VAVGTDDIARVHGASIRKDGVALDSLHHGLPVEADAEFEGAIEQELMQQ
jgi:hypothetical protein